MSAYPDVDRRHHQLAWRNSAQPHAKVNQSQPVHELLGSQSAWCDLTYRKEVHTCRLCPVSDPRSQPFLEGSGVLPHGSSKRAVKPRATPSPVRHLNLWRPSAAVLVTSSCRRAGESACGCLSTPSCPRPVHRYASGNLPTNPLLPFNELELVQPPSAAALPPTLLPPLLSPRRRLRSPRRGLAAAALPPPPPSSCPPPVTGVIAAAVATLVPRVAVL